MPSRCTSRDVLGGMWVPVFLAVAWTAGAACSQPAAELPSRTQCEVPSDDDGRWAADIIEETQCRWGCPPDYVYQQVTPIQGWRAWAPDLSNRSKITVLVIGDAGCESCETQSENLCGTDTGGTNVMVAEAAHRVCNGADHDCDLAVITGDNFYPLAGEAFSNVTTASSDRWQTTWRDNFGRFVESEPDFRFWSSLGNHDYIEGNRIQAQVEYTRHPDNTGHLWMMPDRSYRVPHLPDWLRIWVVDGVAIAEGQKWGDTGQVDRVANEMRTAGDTGWKVAVSHNPALSIGESGVGARSDGPVFRCQFMIETNSARAAAATWALAGMNMMISGHEHDHQLHAGNGFLQVVEGAASKQKPCEFNPDDPSLFAADVMGFSILEFTESEVTVLYFDYSGALLPGGRLTYTRDQVASLTQVLR